LQVTAPPTPLPRPSPISRPKLTVRVGRSYRFVHSTRRDYSSGGLAPRSCGVTIRARYACEHTDL